MSSLASEFPEDCKFYPADTKDDLHKVIVFIIYLELPLAALSTNNIYIDKSTHAKLNGTRSGYAVFLTY